MKTLLDRFWEKVEKREDGCWQWVGALVPDGYGQKWDGAKVITAHRWSYLHFVGPIPDGLQLDHLCRNRGCVNPEHLEPVTPRENTRRGIAGIVNGGRQSAITHCPQNHEYTAENTYWRPDGGGRQCKTCTYERNKARRLARMAARVQQDGAA